MRAVILDALLCGLLALSTLPVVLGRRRRRASTELYDLDMEDVAFYRALVLEGSASISLLPPTDSPTVVPSASTPPPTTGFPTKIPSKAPTKIPVTSSPPTSTPTSEPTVSYEPSLSGFPTASPTDSPTIIDDTTFNFEPSGSGSEEPSKSAMKTNTLSLE